MFIQLGKKKPTPIEMALLKEAGLGNIKGSSITGYYLEPPEQLKITVVNGTILLDDEPLIHQHLNHSQTVRGFTLDIDGLCRKIDPTWNEQSKVDARQGKYKKECIDARVDIYKKFESSLKQSNSAQREMYAASEMFAGPEYIDKAVRELNTARAQIESTRIDHPDIYNQYVVGECYNGILRQREPKFLKSIEEADILEIETARFNSQENAFDPKINIQVPDSIKKIITDLIDIRISELRSNRGVFKRIDKTSDKITALGTLKTQINDSNCSSSDLKELISQWESSSNINDSRSRMSIFKTATSTQRMVDDIKETLDTSKKFGR